MPLSEEALGFARKLATAKYRYPDDRIAVSDLLERWNLGLGTTLAERRMALRLSREQAAMDLPATEEEAVVSLPSVRRALGSASQTAEPEEPLVEGGDDDEADLEDLVEEETSLENSGDEDDFYADTLEDV